MSVWVCSATSGHMCTCLKVHVPMGMREVGVCVLFEVVVCVLLWVCVNMCVVFEVCSFGAYLHSCNCGVWMCVPAAQQVFAEHLLCARAAVNQ